MSLQTNTLVATAFGFLVLTPVMSLAQTDTTSPAATASSPSGAAGAFMAKFRAANTTHDGHLTADQAKAGGMPRVAQNFTAIDADHKGYVTMSDIARYAKSRRNGGQ